MASFWENLRAAFYGTPTVTHPRQAEHIGPSGRLQPVDLSAWIAGRQGEGTRAAKEYGHTDAAFSLPDYQQFLDGEWVQTRSSWVDAVKFDQRINSLYVRVQRGGKEYGPTPCSLAQASAIVSGASIGRAVGLLWKMVRGGR